MTRGAAWTFPIAMDDLSVSYPAHGASDSFAALRGITLRVNPGEVLGVLGESGSGKSTLARVLSGSGGSAGTDVRPLITGGEATVLGLRLRGISRRKLARLTLEVGMLAQDAGQTLPATLTVSELVAEPVLERDARYQAGSLRTLVATMVDAVRLPLTVLTKYPYELSSGQRQRVALARSLVLGPTLLIADEPLAGVDVTVRDAVVDLIGELQRERAFTAVVISSDLAVLRRVTDRIAVLHQGVLVGLGTIDEVFADPWHPYVAELASALTQDGQHDSDT
ncbi:MULTISPECIES: ATP-binding cassette domain-containing protein [unclassified Cryobacterium]|uniref:ATP-binding cassette domain-containing protein n=1 Tax=unclassified Cryobacterium TaxID=2649013 RepID=UPI00106D1703|nr:MULTISPECIES: dipeptide/oligopeptide/nickel ABC transporter ATP-binding protein [unclassified Cryobacterium]TFB92096.1 ABC transporter ATP-binding protein [Cryobacterium sp. MDB2-A-1]TFC11744.1 ABC transporter ATP-binding protein [Cryobacterium sp. MDB2-33-2]TFC15452.1 ABC transporter ATP-binding protein [Cryobacterium sp. MDB2-A-2]TFC20148.1 ABC transporter ATP-binding protein [Cryobacterium sp. MDB2-10]